MKKNALKINDWPDTLALYLLFEKRHCLDWDTDRIVEPIR